MNIQVKDFEGKNISITILFNQEMVFLNFNEQTFHLRKRIALKLFRALAATFEDEVKK